MAVQATTTRRPVTPDPALYGGIPGAPTSPRVTQQTVGIDGGAGGGSLTGPMVNGTTYQASQAAYQPSTTPYTPGATFAGTAPTSTPYGNFTAPDPSQLANDPYYKFRTEQGQQGIERSAAARGTLLSGGLLKSLERYRQGLASEEANNAFNRALGIYTTNRDTNAQNYGQRHTSFQDELDAFRANTDAALGWKREGGAGTGTTTSSGNMGAYDGGGTSYGGTGGGPSAADVQQQIDDAYARQVAATRAQNEQTASMMGTIPTGKPARVHR